MLKLICPQSTLECQEYCPFALLMLLNDGDLCLVLETLVEVWGVQIRAWEPRGVIRQLMLFSVLKLSEI